MMNKMRKMKNKKGFTLMEMLIVVAIIAILIAIAIPTFASSLNKSRIATDEANIRAGYADVMVNVLLDNNYDAENGNASTAGQTKYYLQKDGSVATTDTNAYKTQGKNDSATTEIAGQKVGAWAKDKKVTYQYDNTKNQAVISFE